MLYFSEANAKIETLGKVLGLVKGEKIYSLDLLSGYTCPGAKDCHSKVVLDAAGKRSVKDGRYTQFRCFSASQEVLFPAVYKNRLRNWECIKACRGPSQVCDLILAGLPPNVVRCFATTLRGTSSSIPTYWGLCVPLSNVPMCCSTHTPRVFPLFHRLYLDGYDLSFLYKGVLLHNFLLTGSAGGKV